MKIVHVLPALVKGGAERVAVDLANHATAAGHEVTLIVSKKADETLLRYMLSPEVRVEYVRHTADTRWGPYFALLPWLFANRGLVFNAEILHCHLTFGSLFGTIVRLLRTLSGKKRPAVVESYQAVASPIPKRDRWIHARLAALRDGFAIMADDGFWGEFLKRHPKLPSSIIPNGIAVPQWEPISPERCAEYRRSIGIPDSCRWVVLTIGRIVVDRQPWVFPPVFKEIADRTGPDVHFVFAGEGPLIPQIRAQVAEHGLDGRVHFTGLVRDPALPLSITDVYVTLNVGPVTGIASLEAIYFRLPVVAVQIYPAYRRGATDWLKSSADPVEVAEYVVALLNAQAAREALAAKQYSYAFENLGVESMAKAYERLYRRAIARAAGERLAER